MATRFIERNADPTVGRADVNGNVAIIGVDSDSEEIKYRDVTAGADRTVVTTDQVQTLTNKTITAPVGTEKAEVVTAANVITAAESGTTFYLSAAAGFLSTLPAPALGLWFRFVTKTTPTSNGYTIGTPTADIIFGSAVGRDGAAGVAGSAEDLITLTANNTLPGDEVVLRSDGTNWYAIAQVDVAAAITFTVT